MFCICLIFTFCFTENSPFRSDMGVCNSHRCISAPLFSCSLLTFSRTFISPVYFVRVSREIGRGRGQRSRPMWRSFILLKWPLHLIETYYIFTKTERLTAKLDKKSSNMTADPYKMLEANHYGKGKFNCWQNPWKQTAKLVNISGQLRLRSATIKLSLRSGGTVANEDYPRRGYC